MDNLHFYSEAEGYLKYEYDGPVFKMGPYLECCGITYYLHKARLWKLSPSSDPRTPLVISLEKIFT